MNNKESWADKIMNTIVWGNPEGIPLQHNKKEEVVEEPAFGDEVGSGMEYEHAMEMQDFNADKDYRERTEHKNY